MNIKDLNLKLVNRRGIDKAINARKEWKFNDEILYELCKKKPGHNKIDVIMAKVNIIGRTYAAAIERGRENNGINQDNFFINRVGPMIKDKRRNIDKRFGVLRRKNYEKINNGNYQEIIELHYKIATLFEDINENRCPHSLASKYLHFHFPKLFYIYDSRAKKGLSVIAPRHRTHKALPENADKEYANFVAKVLDLQEDIEKRFGISLTPREIDSLLLQKKK